MSNTTNFKHPLYSAHEAQIEKVNDIYEGIDTAKKYLQQYSQEKATEFSDRQSIATLDNYVFSTIDDIKNIIFRKQLDKSKISNKEIERISKTINLRNTIDEFAKMVLVNRLKEGHTFILVDNLNYNTDEVQNKAQQQAMDIRPYFVNILRSNVLSWKMDDAGVYKQVVIREYYEEDTEFSSEIKEQIKVWYSDGRIAIYRGDELYSTYNTGLSKIPIVKVGDDETPPLYNMAKINITHMNRNSEVDNYTRVGGAAFIAVFGDIGDDAPKTLGINQGLKFQSTMDSDVKWIEMEGRNYEMLKDRIKYHEDQMNRIAVTFTSDSMVKTATQVEKEGMASESKLSNYAEELEVGINTAYDMMSLYKTSGTYGENRISVNKDFDSSILSPEMIKLYKEDYAMGIISYEKLMDVLVAGEYFEKMTDEEMATEKARIKDGGA